MILLPVILAGGTGSRLWPLSRELYPKQIINLTGRLSLLQTTLLRVADLEGSVAPYIVGGEQHRFLVKNQIDELDEIHDYTILLEAKGRNTAPAVCGAAHHAVQNGFEDAVLLVLPADHVVQDVEEFRRCVGQAVDLAAKGKLVTFGITPERAETGYGYLKRGVDSHLEAFVEKPSRERAEEYLQGNNYFWNSGMFAFTARDLLAAMEIHAGEIYEKMTTAVKYGELDESFFRFEEGAMLSCPSDSLDYAVMEKTAKGAIVEADIGWSDVGSWQSLWEVAEKDDCGNVTSGDIVLEEVENCYIRSEKSLVTAVGLTNTMVVETADAVLVAPLDRSQEVKKIVDRLKAEKRDESCTHRTVYRPWGSYTTLELFPRFQIKRITVKPGGQLSLQMHHHRSEHWIVVSGTAKIVNGEESILLNENESTYIPAGKRHRLENPGVIPLELIEVQLGSYLGEDDIVRFEDVYGRKN